jgi:hypothetical protein
MELAEYQLVGPSVSGVSTPIEEIDAVEHSEQTLTDNTMAETRLVFCKSREQSRFRTLSYRTSFGIASNTPEAFLVASRLEE